MGLRAIYLMLLCVLFLGGCVGRSVGDIQRQCAKLDDPDRERRIQALHWFDDTTFWKWTSAEVVAAPSLTPCVVKTARLIESDDPHEALEAAAALRLMVQMMGARAPKTVVPIVSRIVARERAVLGGASPDEGACSHAETLLWILDEVQGMYEGRPPLHYPLPEDAPAHGAR